MANRETLDNSLKRVTAAPRKHQSTIRPVSQVILTLGAERKDAFERARKECLRWLSERAGRGLPKTAWEGQTFDLEEVGAQRVGAVSIESPRYWAARLDDADRTVPQRTWVTEIGLGQTNDQRVLFGARLTCVTRGEDQPYDRSIPGFVRSIVEQVGATLDGRPIGQEPWLVATEEDVDALVKLLLRQDRDTDVIVFALPEDSTDPTQTSVSAHDVHRATIGAAHVAILTGPASFHLTDRLSKEFSVFKQGVRTYLRGFNPDQDEPFRHPLGLPERIANWPGGADAYAKMLISYALARTVARPDREEQLPSYSTVRQIAAKKNLDRAKARGDSDKDLLALALAENEKLRKELEEQKTSYDQLLQLADDERDQAQQEAQQARARADVLRRQVRLLEDRLNELGDGPDNIPIPDSLDDFQSWCERYLTGHVELHNRAYQGVKKSQYHDPKLLYQALLLLRNFYVPMRRQPSDAARQAFDGECRRLRLEESATITESRLGEQGDTYIVRVSGQKRVLDRHLKYGTSRDPRYCFRLYFFWDEDSEQAVVGWLPSHLDTRQT